MSEFERHDGGIHAEESQYGLTQLRHDLRKLADIQERFANAMVDELRGIRHELRQLRELGAQDMAAIDDLTAAVQAEDEASVAAVAYIADLAQKLETALANQTPDDSAQLQGLASDLNTHASALRAALASSTPANPAAAPVGEDVATVPHTTVGDGGNVPAPVDPAPVDGTPAPVVPVDANLPSVSGSTDAGVVTPDTGVTEAGAATTDENPVFDASQAATGVDPSTPSA